ncbi:MAG: hypothetical protein LBK94_06585 [Prevotellaceae bacterium]|jgi:hypothetical protein|nr:hypothetical protein [Prevotellaceae bacterium]
MKKIFIISLLMFSLNVLTSAQQSTTGVAVKYTLTDLQGKKMSNSNYDNYMMYATGRYQVFINSELQKVAVLNITNKKEVLNWGAGEANEYTKYEPHFFVPDFKNFPVIMMLEEVIDGSSNGQHVILMDKGQAFYCGFINLAADKGEGASITKYLQINMKAGLITFTFTPDANIFSWENYEIYKGKEISFEVDTQNAKNGLRTPQTSAYKLTGNASSYPAPEEKTDNSKPAEQQPQKEEYSW